MRLTEPPIGPIGTYRVRRRLQGLTYTEYRYFRRPSHYNTLPRGSSLKIQHNTVNPVNACVYETIYVHKDVTFRFFFYFFGENVYIYT